MAKVLLVDTNFSAGPIFNELTKMGHDVHVVGGNPADYLAKKVLRYWSVDYSSIEALLALVVNERFEYVIPGCNDKSYDSCANLPSKYHKGFDSPETSNILNNKGMFKQWAQRMGLPVAKVQHPDFQTLRWPLIVKPVDAFSGKGITRLEFSVKNDFEMAIGRAKNESSTKQYIVEDYVHGQLYSHSAFIRDQRIFQDFVVREDSTVNPFVVDTSRVIFDFPITILAQIRKCIEEIAQELKLVDGLIHTQLIVKDESFWLIELTRRCPGDLYSQLIEMTTGFPYAKTYATCFLGKSVTDELVKVRQRSIMRHTVTVAKSIKLGYIKFNEALKIERWIPLSLVGDQIQPSPASRIGILFCAANTDDELMKIYGVTLSRNLYEVIE